MDLKKLQEIIDSSELSNEAKDLIQRLIPQVGRAEVQEQIMNIIKYEADMSGLVADEVNEKLNQLKMAEKAIDAADQMEDELLDELKTNFEEKTAVVEEDIKQKLEYKDNFIEDLTKQKIEVADESPKTETAPVVPVAKVEDITPQEAAPVVQPAPVQTTYIQNPGYGGQQYNGAATSTPTQPATFPTAPVMGEQ